MHRSFPRRSSRLLRTAVHWVVRCGVLGALACAPMPEIRGDDTPPLRVLVSQRSTPLLPGLSGDVEREIAWSLAESTGRELVLVTATPGEDALDRLASREVDLVATGLASTTEERAGVTYSLPYRHEDHPVVLALRSADTELRGKVNELLIARAFADGNDACKDDLPAIRRRGSLRLLARPHVASFYLHRGAPRGFEYELLRRFAKEQGLALEIVSPKSAAELESWLLEGRGDVLAAHPEGLLRPRAALAQTRAVAESKLVVCSRDDDPHPVKELGDLAGRTLVVRGNGGERAIAEQLALAVEGLKIEFAPPDAGTVQVLAGVGEGRFDLALAPEHLVRVEQQAGRRIEIALSMESRPLTWGVRSSNRQLLAALDAFLAREYRGSEYNVLWRKYLRSGTAVADAGSRPELSTWDPIVRRWAAEYDLDWRLVTAQMFQESRFLPEAVSPAGAAGLMQIVPETASELELVDPHDPEESIRAGTRYLRWLVNLYEPDLPLATRLRFALASYSAGAGHVMDARKLAGQIGLDPDRWYGNVERAMLLLEQPEYFENARCGYCRGSETVKYVRDIDRRYRLYVQHIPLHEPSDSARSLPEGVAGPLPPA